MSNIFLHVQQNPDPEFDDVISGRVKFAVWRVNTFNLEVVKPKDHGIFYSGDSYLVFHDLGVRKDIFFWIGRDSSVDEYTTVAIKSVELDDLFGGEPIEHREDEGYESQAFKDLFPTGIITRNGGYESGLKEGKRIHEPRLYQIFGDKHPLNLKEVPIAWSNMNHGDTFVLDAGIFIFLWKGKRSTVEEGLGGAKIATRLKDRVGEEIVTVEDGDEDSMAPAEKAVFELFLKLDERSEVKTVSSKGDKSMRNTSALTYLYRCVCTNGKRSFTLVKKGNLERKDLKGEGEGCCFIKSPSGLWLWLDEDPNVFECIARKLLIREGRITEDSSLTVVNMRERRFEPELFKELFTSWD